MKKQIENLLQVTENMEKTLQLLKEQGDAMYDEAEKNLDYFDSQYSLIEGISCNIDASYDKINLVHYILKEVVADLEHLENLK